MNKIYLSDNYVIIEIDRKGVFQYASNRTTYNERFKDGIDNFIIDSSEDGRIFIDKAEINAGLWFTENGVTFYTVETLRTFLRKNTSI